MSEVKIHLDQEDKDAVVAPKDRACKSTREVWYAHRCRAVCNIDEIDPATTTTNALLKGILGVLVKIYWEIRKPKQ